MLKQLMEQWGCDAPDVVIKATETLIDKYGSLINKFGFKGDKLYSFLRSKEPNYKQLTDEFISEYGYAY